jgi:beta-lactamase regulating signal transducer with metallopeptidase domain
MEQVFLTVLNMSITSSYVIIFVLLARLLLKKAPKIFSYSLWGVVLFRLICPFSFSSTLSFFAFLKANTMEHIPANIGYAEQPKVNVGIDALGNLVNNSLPLAAPAASVNPMQIIIYILSLMWVIGAIILITYSLLSYIRLKRKVSTAMLISDNIYECEKIESPFVLGIIKPKVYLPVSLSENERGYILIHEETHIKRSDYLIKPFAYLVLCLHWFNPLVWVSFVLMSRDMEMSCDESVLKKMGKGIKKDYSSSLLALVADKRMINFSPLAFGESNVKERIKNVLNYKNPVFWVVAAAVMLVVVVGIGLAANPKNNNQDLSLSNIKNTASLAHQQEQLMVRAKGSGASLISGGQFGKLLDTAPSNRSEKKISSQKGLAPDLTVYINIASGHKVHFYESEPDLAMVELNGKYRYYKISNDTYEKVNFMKALSSYFIPEEIMKAIADGKRTNLQSVQDVPSSDYRILTVGKESYYIYKENSKYYVEQPYQFISEISEKIYTEAIRFAASPTTNGANVSSEVKNLVEDNIANIMSSPQQSSNPNDYIKINMKGYENIIKQGENALFYMLSEFRNGNVKNDLRGQIMMRLCKELLGERNNVDDETLLPNEWFTKLAIRQKVGLPDFTYEGKDPIQKLVYSTEIEKNRDSRGGFTIVAPHIFGSYEEGNKLKVFATTFITHYILYDKTLSEEGGSIVPVAITYVKNTEGSYTLEKYEQARDGSEFSKSIREFSVMPLSGKRINGLSDKILKHYGNYNDIVKLERENLIEHLKKNSQNGVFFYQKNYQKPDELVPIT